jgi:hypothetical protein
MTIFVVETYLVKLDKLGDYQALGKKFEAFMKKRPSLFKEVKSHKVFSHLFGGNWGGYVEMTEVESMADVEKFYNRLMADKEFMAQIYQEFIALIVPGTYSLNMWNSVP